MNYLNKTLVPFFIIFFLVCPVPTGLAKDKPPPVYEQGILLDIKESQEVVTSYKSVKEKDGTVTTTPINEKESIYHLSVRVGDMVYVGKYKPVLSFKKLPPWIIGDPISVRFQKNKMYLQKPNGKDLKTSIEKRVRATSSFPQ